MSHSFIDPKNDYYNVNTDSDTPQKEIDPVAQLKWLSTPQVHGGWGVFNNDQPAQMFAQDVEEQKTKTIQNGGGVLIKDNEALKLLKLGLSEEEAKFISLSSDGFIDINLLKQGDQSLNVGGNYKLLLEISQSSKTIEIIVSYSQEGINGNNQRVTGKDIPFQFQELANDARDMWIIYGGANDFTGTLKYGQLEMNFEEFKQKMNLQDKYTPNGGVGKTSAPYGTPPNTDFDRKMADGIDPENQIFSTNENYQIYINKYLLDNPETIRVAVVTLAHELYGHLYAMFKGTSSSHGPVRTKNDNATEWNYNEELENRIIERTKEAEDNFNTRNN